jgi:hypothetical protein
MWEWWLGAFGSLAFLALFAGRVADAVTLLRSWAWPIRRGWVRLLMLRRPISAWMELALADFERGDPMRAFRTAGRILTVDPHHEGAFYVRVLVGVALREPGAVAKEVLAALPSLRRRAATCVLLAHAYLKRGERKEARFWYNEARQDPDYITQIRPSPECDELERAFGGADRAYS